MFEHELTVLWMSKESYAPGRQTLELHSHRDIFHYVYILKSNAKMQVGSDIRDATAGLLARTPAGGCHGILFERHDGFLQAFELKFKINNPDLADKVSSLPFFYRFDNSRMDAMADELLRLAIGREPYYQEQICLKVIELLLFFLKQQTMPAAQPEPSAGYEPNPHYDASIADIIGFMRENVVQSMSLDALARRCGMSKYYFLRTFKAATGDPPIRYWNRLKIERAKQMMLRSELNISQISQNLGFDNVHTFSRLFKNIARMAPTEFIKKYNPELYLVIDPENFQHGPDG